ncbi:MAG: beta-ketoacyl synthase, partial [Flavobacterium sp.]|nr:beta-ketoacyl synthase [Flavobacterium sp.]
MQPISITAIASLSPLGNDSSSTWQTYLKGKPCFSLFDTVKGEVYAAQLNSESKARVDALRQSDLKYKSLDNSVLFAILASRDAVSAAGWDSAFGINLGSSRGATALFETHHKEFLESGKAHTLASPSTTLGNISSWVAHDLQQNGPEISHSITCSTALHAMLNAVAWLRAGMADKFLVGGSEAPLTSFTVAQMRALKIYSNETGEFPSRASDFSKTKNSMILGEGASVCCMEIGRKKNAIAMIEGMGYATELLKHGTSISANAECLQKSMRMALKNTSVGEIDAIVMHAPGTMAGDSTELAAIQAVFGKNVP